MKQNVLAEKELQADRGLSITRSMGFLRAIGLLAAALVLLTTGLHAQVIYTPGNSLVEVFLSSADSADANPGSPLTLNLDLEASGPPGGTDSIDSFSFTFNPDSNLTNPSFSASLPAGWTSSFSGETFSGQNVSGSDIVVSGPGTGLIDPSDATVLGSITYTVSPTASGVSIGLTSSLEDAEGNGVPSLPLISGVAVPEPSQVAQFLLGLVALIVLRFRISQKSLGANS